MDMVFNRVIGRDIDLLLAEELVSSHVFLEWLLARIGMVGEPKLRRVAQSVSTSTGESGVEVFVAIGGRVVAALIEDKIGAVFQPHQEERYQKRCRAPKF